MERVASEARSRWPVGQKMAAAADVTVTITNFHLGGHHDVDNVIKPILDAMNGVIYMDDRYVIRVISQRVDLSDRSVIQAPSALVAEGLEAFPEFVHVVVFWEERG